MESRNLGKPAFVATLAVVAVAPFTLARLHPGVIAARHYFRGRASNCTLSQSVDSGSIAKTQFENGERIRAASHIIRKDGSYSLWQTPRGEFWMPAASGDAVTYDLAEQQRDIYGKQIHPGAIVLDAGASVGVFTRKALLAGAAKVISIEPAPENIECLRRNFAAEIAAGRVVVYPKGVWDKDDVLKLSVDPGNSARDSFVRTRESAQYVEAPLTTVDKLVAELQLPRVDFIKMDIEGAERKAIDGARSVIARFKPHMALCVYHTKGDETAIPQMVKAIRKDYAVNQSCLCGADRIQPEVAFFD